MRIKVKREYELVIPEGPTVINDLINLMIADDPDIETGNYGNPSPQWLFSEMVQWATHQADAGNELLLELPDKKEVYCAQAETSWEVMP
jgi:hypothetical protein